MKKYGFRENFIDINPPKPFNFNECLVYLWRSQNEVLHCVEDGYLYKLLDIEDQLQLIRIDYRENRLSVELLENEPDTAMKSKIADYVWQWFDLDTDLSPFYHMAEGDVILKPLTEKYRGLRIIKIHDLFESLCWAIIGQQINLTFAYTLKRRLVEAYGRSKMYHDKLYWVFPVPESIAGLDGAELKALQFTGRKAEYIIGVAKLFAAGQLCKQHLEAEATCDGIRDKLMDIRGIGQWTADYVMLKSFNCQSAFPIADVGLHNALKNLMGRSTKPSIEEISQLARNWRGWEAYAAFYLWRSLYNGNS